MYRVLIQLPQSTPHSFRITVNPDGNDSFKFRLKRDELLVANFHQLQQSKGFVLAGIEAESICDSMHSHYWNLRKCIDSPQLAGSGCDQWSGWSDVDNTNTFTDASKWWYFDRISTSEFYLRHCSSAYCPDQ